MATLTSLLVRINGSTEGLEQAVEETPSRLERARGKIDLAAAGIGAGLGVAMAAGFAGALEAEAAGDKLVAQLGASGDEAVALADTQQAVWAAGWGESADEVGQAIVGVQRNIGDLAGDTGLDVLATKALAVAQTFDQDLNMTTAAAGQLLRTGLATSADEAFDIITTGLQSSADKSGDYLETLNEYSTLFRQIGLDGQTATGLIAQGMAAGARDSDQLADALGIFSEMALKGGTAVEDAFSSIGLSASEMSAKMQEGGPAAQSALQMTMDALRGTSDEQVRLNAAAALFGDPANTLGAALYALDPATAAAAAGMQNMEGATDRMVQTVADNPAAAFETFKRTAMQRLTEIAGGFAQFAMANQGAIQPMMIGLAALAAVILLVKGGMMAWTAATTVWAGVQKLVTAGQWLWNAAMAANPIILITLLVIGLVAGVILLYQHSETARNIINGAFSGIWSAIKFVWDWVSQNWPLLLAILTGPIGLAVLAISRHWETIKSGAGSVLSFITDLPGKIQSALSSVGEFVSAPFKWGFNKIAEYWNKTAGQVGFKVPSFVPGVGGKGFSIPKIPLLATGGTVTSTGLALIHEGETVLPAGTATLPRGATRGGGGGGATLELRSSGSRVDDLLLEILRGAVRARGGDVQTVVGS